jgi:uronate dehydrogenase
MAGIDPQTGRVLITGATGMIGTMLRAGLRPRWRHLRLVVRRPVPDLAANEEIVIAQVDDRAAMTRAMEGVDAVVHLAAAAYEIDLETLFRANMRGVFDVFEAARLGGVKRIVFASSNHAFGAWPITERVSPQHLARPDTLYGVSKVMAEAMLQYYFDRHAIRSVSVRIGTCRPEPIDQRSLATWLSPRDMVQLFELGLTHDDPGALVVNGYSANTRLKTYDPNWGFLGYAPRDNAEAHVEMLRAKGIDVDGPWEWPEHGGAMAREPEWPPFP